ncbi:winged helix-turn-helix transcriptional regulator [Microbispora siamensis]|nr:helix-turn-helix domain-containing protein [Microbispora siamensis]
MPQQFPQSLENVDTIRKVVRELVERVRRVTKRHVDVGDEELTSIRSPTKWSMMVMAVLNEPRRFNDIKRRLEGVTQRVLTQTLRRLERNGMITRRVLPTSPVGVEYSLTPLGESLREPFGRLYDWTVDNADEIQRHQMEYDRRVQS